MTMDMVEKHMNTIAADLAAYWFRAQSRNPSGRYYLYHFEPRECDVISTFAIDVDAPLTTDNRKGILSWPESLSPAWTEDQAKAFIISVMRKTPCIGGAAYKQANR